MQHLFFFPFIPFTVLFNFFPLPFSNLHLIRNNTESGCEHRQNQCLFLEHLFQASRHHCFPFPTASLLVPTATGGAAHVWTQDPRAAALPHPHDPRSLATSGTGTARGGRPGCQGNGRTPGSRPHRLHPEKGRRPAADSCLPGGEGRGAARGREDVRRQGGRGAQDRPHARLMGGSSAVGLPTRSAPRPL